jgi:hypothetical protein
LDVPLSVPHLVKTFIGPLDCCTQDLPVQLRLTVNRQRSK